MDIFEWTEEIPVTANNLNEMQNTLGGNFGLKGKLLWKNISPTSSFPSQNITLSSSDYDVLEIYYNQGTSNTKCWCVKVIKGYGTDLTLLINFNAGVSSQSIDGRARGISYVNDTTYAISDCLERSGSGTTAPGVNNGGLIPLYIIGYKTGLIN